MSPCTRFCQIKICGVIVWHQYMAYLFIVGTFGTAEVVNAYERNAVSTVGQFGGPVHG